MRTDIILRKLTTGIGERFEPSTTGVQLEGMVVRIDLETGLARSIEAIREPCRPTGGSRTRLAAASSKFRPPRLVLADSAGIASRRSSVVTLVTGGTSPMSRRLALLLGTALAALFALGGTASAATLTAHWTNPGATVAPHTTPTWQLDLVVSGGPTNTDDTFTVDLAPGGNDDAVLGGGLTLPAGIDCGAPAVGSATTLDCSVTAALADGTYSLGIPVALPPHYVADYNLHGAKTAGSDALAGDLNSDPIDVTTGADSQLQGRLLNPVDGGLDHVAKGGVGTGQLSVHNFGAGAASFVTYDFTTSNAAKFTITDISIGLGACVPITRGYRCDLGAIAPGGTTTVNFAVTGLDFGSANVDASLDSKGDGGGNAGADDSQQVQVTDGTTAEIRTSFVDGSTILPGTGGTAVYVLAITNAGPNVLTPAKLAIKPTLTSPADAIAGVSSTLPAACAADTAYGAKAWSCNFTTLNPGATALVTIAVNVAPLAAPKTEDDVQVEASFDLGAVHAYLPRTNGGSTQAFWSTQVGGEWADLDLAVAAPASAQLTKGGAVTWTVINHGPSVARSVSIGGRLTDAIWLGGPVSCTGSHLFECDLGNIAPGKSATVTVQLRGTAIGKLGRAVATARSNQFDPVADNDQQSIAFGVVKDLPAQVVVTLGKAVSLKIASAIKTGVPTTVTLDRPGLALVQLYIAPKTAVALHMVKKAPKKPVLIGSAKAAAKQGTKLTLTARLSASARTHLKTYRKNVAIAETITVSSAGSTSRIVKRTITIKR